MRARCDLFEARVGNTAVPSLRGGAKVLAVCRVKSKAGGFRKNGPYQWKQKIRSQPVVALHLMSYRHDVYPPKGGWTNEDQLLAFEMRFQISNLRSVILDLPPLGLNRLNPHDLHPECVVSLLFNHRLLPFSL
jgi:hypothetical protein